MVRPQQLRVETVQDQEWHSWRQFKAEQHKYEQEYNEWKKPVQKPQVKARVTPISEPHGRDLVKEVCNRFAF